MRWRLLAHPYFTGALALLALNDHVLKGVAPSVVTGKLSDFAGVFVAAVMATVLTRRPRFATSAVGLGFGAIKLTPVAASLAAPLLGGVTRQDTTDLVALVMLVPALRFSRRSFSIAREQSFAQVFVSTLAGAVAVLAVTATSCYRPPTVDAFVVREDGTVLARVTDETYDDAGNAVPAPKWALSTDGGITWRAARERPTEGPSSSDQACSDDVGCFRVQRGRVEHAEGAEGPFRVAFTFTPEQRERMQWRTDANCDVSTTDLFKAVAIVTRPDGAHVVVAMGSQGALHRSPDGEWSRVAVLDRKPVSLHGPSWLRDLSLAPLIVIALSPIPLVLAWRRRGRGRGLAALAVGAGGGVLLLSLAGGLMFFGLDYVIAGPFIALMASAAFAASLAFAFVGRRSVPVATNQPP
jgi:hypothetical protein